MDWAPQDGTTLHVVDLRDGSRRSFRAPPCFVFHWANAFESPDGRCAGAWGLCRFEIEQLLFSLSTLAVRPTLPTHAACCAAGT